MPPETAATTVSFARTPQSSLRAASKRCSRALDASVAKRALRASVLQAAAGCCA